MNPTAKALQEVHKKTGELMELCRQNGISVVINTAFQDGAAIHCNACFSGAEYLCQVAAFDLQTKLQRKPYENPSKN